MNIINDGEREGRIEILIIFNNNVYKTTTMHERRQKRNNIFLNKSDYIERREELYFVFLSSRSETLCHPVLQYV